MNWTANDMDTYLQQKEYIDTVIIPLVNIASTAEEMKQSASAAEFLMHLTAFIEKQFKGRLMLLPPFSYTSSMEKEKVFQQWKADLAGLPFKHRFFLTTDPVWNAPWADGEVIWLPSLPLESMEPRLRQSVIEDQLRQLLPILTKKWTEG